MKNRKFWMVVGFDLLVLALSALALRGGMIGASHWVHAIEIVAWVTFGYAGINAGQKVGLTVANGKNGSLP